MVNMNKKLVIAGSASLVAHIEKWKEYWIDQGYDVTNHPKSIDPDNFDQLYPNVHASFFKSLDMADVLFIMNEDKKGIKGYIGYETFAELGYTLTNNLLGRTSTRIILLQYPENSLGCNDEVVRWSKYGWIEILKP
jgi:hypothetical protein